MARNRFGPNSVAVEAFLARLGKLGRSDWEEVVEAAPGIGALPELEISMAPEYFKAFEAAAKIAKRPVFPGSETAFFDAMRSAETSVGANIFKQAQPESSEHGGPPPESGGFNPEAEAEAFSRTMLEGYEDEAWRRVTNAAAVAVGALVVRQWLSQQDFSTLCSPFKEAFAGERLDLS